MCFNVQNAPGVPDQKRFKSVKGAQKAISDSLAMHPTTDLDKVNIKDKHTGKVYKP